MSRKEKLEQLVLNCIKYGADEDGKITIEKLKALVYLCDFSSYYFFLKPITNIKYKKINE